MTHIPAANVISYVGDKASLNIKAIARDVYDVSFPQLLADYLDPEKDIVLNGKVYTADMKSLPGGVAAFNLAIDTLSKKFESAYKIFELQLNDVNLMRSALTSG